MLKLLLELHVVETTGSSFTGSSLHQVRRIYNPNGTTCHRNSPLAFARNRTKLPLRDIPDGNRPSYGTRRERASVPVTTTPDKVLQAPGALAPGTQKPGSSHLLDGCAWTKEGVGSSG